MISDIIRSDNKTTFWRDKYNEQYSIYPSTGVQ